MRLDEVIFMAKKKSITLVNLVLMTFTTIYGFANTTIAYDQMGYASIIWYILAALLFLLPSSLMFAEYGAAFKDAHGGIYSWMAGSIGERWAFIGTFIWLSSWIIWTVSAMGSWSLRMISSHDSTMADCSVWVDPANWASRYFVDPAVTWCDVHGSTTANLTQAAFFEFADGDFGRPGCTVRKWRSVAEPIH